MRKKLICMSSNRRDKKKHLFVQSQADKINMSDFDEYDDDYNEDVDQDEQESEEEGEEESEEEEGEEEEGEEEEGEEEGEEGEEEEGEEEEVVLFNPDAPNTPYIPVQSAAPLISFGPIGGGNASPIPAPVIKNPVVTGSTNFGLSSPTPAGASASLNLGALGAAGSLGNLSRPVPTTPTTFGPFNPPIPSAGSTTSGFGLGALGVKPTPAAQTGQFGVSTPAAQTGQVKPLFGSVTPLPIAPIGQSVSRGVSFGITRPVGQTSQSSSVGPFPPITSTQQPAPAFSAQPAPAFSAQPAPAFSAQPAPAFSAQPQAIAPISRGVQSPTRLTPLPGPSKPATPFGALPLGNIAPAAAKPAAPFTPLSLGNIGASPAAKPVAIGTPLPMANLSPSRIPGQGTSMTLPGIAFGPLSPQPGKLASPMVGSSINLNIGTAAAQTNVGAIPTGSQLPNMAGLVLNPPNEIKTATPVNWDLLMPKTDTEQGEWYQRTLALAKKGYEKGYSAPESIRLARLMVAKEQLQSDPVDQEVNNLAVFMKTVS